jgi:four helix bundle protein
MQSAKGKVQSEAGHPSDPARIDERTVAYALRVVKLYRTIQIDAVGRVLGGQLLRSGTSIGANVHEAQGAQSKADFIAKMSIAQKEAHESLYWLRLIKESDLVPAPQLSDLVDETHQLVRILSAILITAKERTPARR